MQCLISLLFNPKFHLKIVYIIMTINNIKFFFYNFILIIFQQFKYNFLKLAPCS